MIPKKSMEKPYKKGFIGKFAKIEAGNCVFEGEIILETKNTIQIRTKEGKKTIIKQNATITIGEKRIRGEKTTKRIEDRIKGR